MTDKYIVFDIKLIIRTSILIQIIFSYEISLFFSQSLVILLFFELLEIQLRLITDTARKDCRFLGARYNQVLLDQFVRFFPMKW